MQWEALCYNSYMIDKGAKLMLGEIPLSEEDVKIRFITPALERAGWFKERMRTEVSLTDGRVLLSGNKPGRGAKKRADYLLWHHPNANPIAVVEAKGADVLPSFGLQQAINYAKLCGASFAYASNGQAFEEYDLLTGLEREFPMEAFPSPEALHKRFLAHGDGGEPLSAAEAGLLCEPYYVSATNPKTPRCYQRCAVTNALKAIAKGERRILLVLATGTGKTFIAFQIVWRLLQRGLCHRVLFLADRNILVDQAQANDFAPLANVCHKIDFNKDLNNRVGNSAYQVYFGLYHQFYGDWDEPEEEETGVDKPMRAALLFPPDFFDLVIVDECHRGSARDNSRWRKILDYFSSARQLGMTATPRETEDASNSAYFGEPVYSYSLAQGIDDGFLAPFYVRRIKTNIGEGWRPAAGQLDYFGNPIPDRDYSNRDYDTSIVIADRIREVAQTITDILRDSGDPMAKTIVFCPTIEAAERMRKALVELNQDLMRKCNGDYVVRITGGNGLGNGKDKLDAFASVTSKTPVIAVSSQLLSTGVDTKLVKFVVIDKNVASMSEFKQIIGRGTRLDEKHGKCCFTILDFRDVTTHFEDPDWDGAPEPDERYGVGEDTLAGEGEAPKTPSDTSDDTPRSPTPFVSAEGCPVHVIGEEVGYLGADGKVLAKKRLADYAKEQILARWADFRAFRDAWLAAADHAVLLAPFAEERGLDLPALRASLAQADCDLYDVIAHLAYGKPLIRAAERAQAARQSILFTRQKGDVCRAVLSCLLDHYESQGPDALANLAVLKLPAFQGFGSPRAIADRFGGRAAYLSTVRGLFSALYKD